MVVSCIKESNGRKYIEHNGKPYMFYGVQIRIDDAVRVGHTPDIAEEYFKVAAQSNFRTIVVLIGWNEIEQYINSQECTPVSNIIALAEKYDLMLQWCWFGSNVCAVQHCVPKYIWQDDENYPKYMYNNEKYIDFSSPKVIELEKRAINYFLQMLKKYDVNRRTVVIQIENEPDFFDWRNQRKERIAVLDIIGKEVKKSDFKVVTRVNITAPQKYCESDNLIEEILALEGIDLVGVDVYYNKLSYYDMFIAKMSEFSDNIPHFAEMGAHTDNLPLILCNAFVKGAGCLLYELRTTYKRDYDFGLYRFSEREWIRRDGNQLVQHQWTEGDNVPECNTDQICKLNNTINTLALPLSLTGVNDMALLFGNEEAMFNGTVIRNNFSGKGVNDFIAVVNSGDGYIYLFSPVDGVKVSVSKAGEIEENSGNGWISSDYTLYNGKAYRIKA